MLRWVVIAIVVLAGIWVLGGTAVLAGARELPDRATSILRGDGSGQSGAQISLAEFVEPRNGATTDRVRALVGEPESTSTAHVEGIELECWTYGISGASGAFQFCFADGRLSSRFRYVASVAP